MLQTYLRFAYNMIIVSTTGVTARQSRNQMQILRFAQNDTEPWE